MLVLNMQQFATPFDLPQLLQQKMCGDKYICGRFNPTEDYEGNKGRGISIAQRKVFGSPKVKH